MWHVFIIHSINQSIHQDTQRHLVQLGDTNVAASTCVCVCVHLVKTRQIGLQKTFQVIVIVIRSNSYSVIIFKVCEPIRRRLRPFAPTNNLSWWSPIQVSPISSKLILVFKIQIIKYIFRRKSCSNIFIISFICSDFYADMDMCINNLSVIQQVRMSHCAWGPVA